jgi:type III restriction enzyme
LDFSATPKNDKGVVFPHVVCDTPLGEAVDAGIIKTPVIGKSRQIVEQPHDDAAYRFEAHLRLGYERWKRSQEEWGKSGKKPLLFVMCENTDAADQITNRLNSDAVFKELNGKSINLHTNLKGRIKKQKIDGKTVEVFIEDEKAISDEDLKALRRISRDLDKNESQYTCIVSVLMLREGWDVRNVTTIVPLRPLTAQSKILPEQTLGRGLRRMTPPGEANELVTVIEHPSFINLYEQELEQEGLPITIEDVEKVPATTVTIFPDESRDLGALDIVLPVLTAAHEIQPRLEGLSIEDVGNAFKPFKALPLGNASAADIEYEGRALITDELVESMKISLPLLQNGITAISFFVRELEAACRVQSTHTVLAPLLQKFLGEMLFGENVSLVDKRLTGRLSDQDVREHIRAVFIPLIRARTVTTEKRRAKGAAQSLRHWKPYQATFSENRPVERAARTLFNLVPCNRSLEVATAKFVDKAPDVGAFAKNAGPQAVRIDYLTNDHRLAFYTPDFFVRDLEGSYYLVETKGRQDQDVPRKASAAVEWCKTASRTGTSWRYVFVPQAIMEGLTSSRFADLVRACAPALQNLLSETTAAPELPFFGEQAREKAQAFYSEATLEKLSARERKAAEDAAELYRYFEKKGDGANFAPAFNALLGPFDEAAKSVILKLLQPTGMTRTTGSIRLWEMSIGRRVTGIKRWQKI